MSRDETNSHWFKDVLSSVFETDDAADSNASGAASLSTSPGVPAYAPSSTPSGCNDDGGGRSGGSDDFWVNLASKAEEAARDVARNAAAAASSAGSDVGSTVLEAEADPLDVLDVGTLSVKELKALVSRAGLSLSDCREKSDLKLRACEALARLVQARDGKRTADLEALRREKRGTGALAAADSVAKMDGKHPLRVLAGLECICVGEKWQKKKAGQKGGDAESQVVEPPDFLVFCFHGYQATAASLATLADVIRASVVHSKGGEDGKGGQVVFVLPQSPGAGWWGIDFASYAFAMAMGEETKARVLRQVPSGVVECRAQIAQLVFEARRLYSSCPSAPSPLFPLNRTFFMGFSQGAMLALDTALHLSANSAEPPAPSPSSLDNKWWDPTGSVGALDSLPTLDLSLDVSLNVSLDSAVSALDTALETVTHAATASSATSAKEQQGTTTATATEGSSSKKEAKGGEGVGGGRGGESVDKCGGKESPVGGCVLVSGFLMDVDTWGLRLNMHHRDLRVLQLHGVNDALIPFGTAKWLQALLSHYSKRAVFVPHGGGHDIPPSVLSSVSSFLATAMVV